MSITTEYFQILILKSNKILKKSDKNKKVKDKNKALTFYRGVCYTNIQ